MERGINGERLGVVRADFTGTQVHNAAVFL